MGSRMKQNVYWLSLLPFLAACAVATPLLATATPTSRLTTLPGTPCGLSPIVVPTPLAVTPGPAELDITTGLHVMGRAQTIQLETYRLEVTGKVDNPMSLTYDDLRCMPKIEMETTIVCKGNFEDTAVWAGVPLRYVLELAGVQDGATDVQLTGIDGYAPIVGLDAAMSERSFLAYELRGQPVPILHGFPVRAAFPGELGAYWVKWLIKMEVK
jgi:DMSO/TMAO reductase YedYZ molybdopterin-dependent catalytic subunit